jgi:hypothetical protein
MFLIESLMLNDDVFLFQLFNGYLLLKPVGEIIFLASQRRYIGRNKY